MGNDDAESLERVYQARRCSKKTEWDIKENTALNIVHDFLKDGYLDEDMQSLIRMNHNFYRFIYSTTINIIYFNTK